MSEVSGQRVSASKAEKALRRAQALELRLAGKTYAAIGAEMGISDVAAWKLVTRALARIEEKTAHDREKLRAMEVQRSEAVIAELWPARGDPQAANAIAKQQERIARLRGLDAPEKREVTGNGGGPLHYALDVRFVDPVDPEQPPKQPDPAVG